MQNLLDTQKTHQKYTEFIENVQNILKMNKKCLKITKCIENANIMKNV